MAMSPTSGLAYRLLVQLSQTLGIGHVCKLLRDGAEAPFNGYAQRIHRSMELRLRVVPLIARMT